MSEQDLAPRSSALRRQRTHWPVVAVGAFAVIGIAWGLLAILLSSLVGRNIAAVDPRLFATVSLAIVAVVLSMRSQFNTDAGFLSRLVSTILQGAAVAVFDRLARPARAAAGHAAVTAAGA